MNISELLKNGESGGYGLHLCRHKAVLHRTFLTNVTWYVLIYVKFKHTLLDKHKPHVSVHQDDTQHQSQHVSPQ